MGRGGGGHRDGGAIQGSVVDAGIEAVAGEVGGRLTGGTGLAALGGAGGGIGGSGRRIALTAGGQAQGQQGGQRGGNQLFHDKILLFCMFLQKNRVAEKRSAGHIRMPGCLQAGPVIMQKPPLSVIGKTTRRTGKKKRGRAPAALCPLKFPSHTRKGAQGSKHRLPRHTVHAHHHGITTVHRRHLLPERPCRAVFMVWSIASPTASVNRFFAKNIRFGSEYPFLAKFYAVKSMGHRWFLTRCSN